MSVQAHWEKIYGTKAPDQVSWYRPHLETSIRLIERAAGGDCSVSIADVGGGASTLVDDLVDRGYANITVVDISESALDIARKRLGPRAGAVRWVCGDVTHVSLPARSLDVWHDRAVFHFLTNPEDRLAYVHRVSSAIKPRGHVIVSTFGPEGPKKCSGLEVVRYDADSLHSEFGSKFHLVESLQEIHETPFGTTQQFVYCHCTVESLTH